MKKYTLHILYISLFAILIFGFTYLPLQDYPVLIYHGFVFNQVVFHGFDFGGFFHFHQYVPPNAVSTVLTGILNILANPFFAGKIYIFLLAIILYSGIVRYLRVHLDFNSTTFASIAFYLTLNLHFFMNYLNFLTGLALVFHAIVFFRKNESRYWFFFAAILIIYLSHFAALAIFFLYFFVYFLKKKNGRGLFQLGISSIPAMGLFVHYLLNRSMQVFPSAGDYVSGIIDIIHWKILIFFSPLIPFNVFKWVTEIPLSLRFADYFFVGVTTLLIFFILLRSILKNNFTLEFWLAAITFILAIFLPLTFGGVTPAGERVVVFCIVNISILFYREKIDTRIKSIAFGTCFLLGIAMYSYDLWNTEIFNTMAQSNNIPQDAIVHGNEKLEGTNPFLHLHFYEDIKNKRPYPAFGIGLFDFPGSGKVW